MEPMKTCIECSDDIRTGKNTPFCSKRCKHVNEIRIRTAAEKHYVRDIQDLKYDPTQPLRKIRRCLWCRAECLKTFCVPAHEELYDKSRANVNSGKTYSEYLQESGLAVRSVDFY